MISTIVSLLSLPLQYTNIDLSLQCMDHTVIKSVGECCECKRMQCAKECANGYEGGTCVDSADGCTACCTAKKTVCYKEGISDQGVCEGFDHTAYDEHMEELAAGGNAPAAAASAPAKAPAAAAGTGMAATAKAAGAAAPEAGAKQTEGTPQDKYIHICLLYTSPSPRDRQKSRMPSSA